MANPILPTAAVTASASPASVTTSHFPAPTTAPLVERCEEEHCSYGGEATTLQADVVTSTILSTTSVPCYITTYVTESQTITETIYSTETITSTVTKEGTVFIIQYSPTPVLMSVPVTSVTEIQITNTWWSYWMTTEGSAYQVTSKGGEQTYGGNDGCDDCHKTYDDGGWNSKSSDSGWGSSEAAAGNGVASSMVNWNHGSRRADATGWNTRFAVVLAVSVAILAWEIIHCVF
ncbi:hypothetical protein IAT40_000449 [Kwoniella sp. CBS 6097]